MVYLVKHFVHFIRVLEGVLRMFVSLEQNVNKNLNKVTDEKSRHRWVPAFVVLISAVFFCERRVFASS